MASQRVTTAAYLMRIRQHLHKIGWHPRCSLNEVKIDFDSRSIHYNYYSYKMIIKTFERMGWKMELTKYRKNTDGSSSYHWEMNQKKK